MNGNPYPYEIDLVVRRPNGNMPISLRGFPSSGGIPAFVIVRLGRHGLGETTVLLDPQAARRLGDGLLQAADRIAPREVNAADLGLASDGERT